METQATVISESQEDINTWAYIELFGHSKIAGRITTRKLGTEIMFQIDVPKGTETEFSHSQLFSPKAIFSINPTTEEWCRKFAAAAQEYGKPVLPYIPEARQLVQSTESHKPYEDYED